MPEANTHNPLHPTDHTRQSESDKYKPRGTALKKEIGAWLSFQAQVLIFRWKTLNRCPCAVLKPGCCQAQTLGGEAVWISADLPLNAKQPLAWHTMLCRAPGNGSPGEEWLAWQQGKEKFCYPCIVRPACLFVSGGGAVGFSHFSEEMTVCYLALHKIMYVLCTADHIGNESLGSSW